MGNERREPGSSELDNLYYLAHYKASDGRLRQCKSLLSLIALDGVEATSTQKVQILRDALATVVLRDAKNGIMQSRDARGSNKSLMETVTFPMAAVGELLGLLEPAMSIEVALARGYGDIAHKLTRKDKGLSDSKRERQARASVWMGLLDLKYYSKELRERELLDDFLNAVRDEVGAKEFKRRAAASLVDMVTDTTDESSPRVPDMSKTSSDAEGRSSSRWMPWVWRAAIPVVLVFAVVVGIAVYNKAQSSDSCAPGDASCLPFSILVETDLDRIAPGVPVGAYLFKPGAFAAAPKKPSCADGYRTQEWARQHGGVPAGLQYVRVSITAKDKPILVNFAEVEANYMTNHPGDVATCLDGTQLDVRQLAVDTDRETTTYYSRFDTQRGLVSEPLALHIAPGEAEVIVVSAKATTKDASWHLKLGMDIGGERIEHVIRDTNGQDFQLAASEESGRTTYTEAAPYRWEVLDW